MSSVGGTGCNIAAETVRRARKPGLELMRAAAILKARLDEPQCAATTWKVIADCRRIARAVAAIDRALAAMAAEREQSAAS